jgi:hypothetical protein
MKSRCLLLIPASPSPWFSALPLAALSLTTLCFIRPCFAQSDRAQVVARTAEQIADERWGEAILTAEEAADEGVVHPDLSFNRGLAYLGRAKTAQKEQGDLGQAAAGFAETLLFRPDEPEAERGLEQAQLLVARDRTQGGSSPETSSLGLLEGILAAISPLFLALLSGLSSVVLALGLLLRASHIETRKVSGGILALIGASMLLPAVLLATTREALFQNSIVAVVIADRADLLDAAGGRLHHQLPYRQGTVVHLGKPSAGLAPVISLGKRSHISLSRVRLLRSPRQ